MTEAELTTVRGKQLPYLHGLDGLRAVAVLAVLFYHADARWLRGGYLGVEVFFVLSGYLITSGLRAQFDGSGRLDLPGFWAGRARRLFPALYALLAATLLFSVLMDTTPIASLRLDALAAVGEVANWRFVFSHQSYFESFGRPPLLQHLWSLGIEEQFYLAWPPLFLLLWRRLGARRSAMATGGAALVSWAVMALLFHPGVDPSRVYYGTDTRLGGILIGATLALVWAPWRKPVERPVTGITRLEYGGLAALFVILGCFAVLRDANPFLYRGGFALIDLSTALVIAAAIDPSAILLPSMLGSRALRWLGVRSYGIYLWHWPIFMVTRPGADVPLHGLPLFLLRLGLTLAVAALSYRFVEQPIRTRGYRWLWDRAYASLTAPAWRPRVPVYASMAGAVLLFEATIIAHGPETPYFPAPAYHGIVADVRAATPAPAATEAPAFVVRADPTADATIAPTETPAPTPIVTPPPRVQAPAPPAPSLPPPAPVETPAPKPISSSSSTTAPGATTTPVVAPSPGATSAPVSVLALGDSVLLGAYGALGQLGTVEVDAAVGRQPYAVAATVAWYASRGVLPEAVVIHVGNNGVFGGALADMLSNMTGVKRVVLVTLWVDQPWEADNNAQIRAAAARYPNVRIADWHATVAQRPEILYSDGLHVRPEWAWVYADLLGAALHAP